MEERRIKKERTITRKAKPEVFVEERKGEKSIVKKIAKALREGQEDKTLFERLREINRKNLSNSDELQQLLYESESSLEGPIMLLLKGANPNGWGAKRRFRLACIFNEKEVVRLFIEAGMDLNSTNNFGLTSLIEALQFGQNPNIVKLLLENGADPNKKSNDGWSPLMWAFSCGALRIAKILEKKGADRGYFLSNINSINAEGFTMLTSVVFARSNCWKRSIEALLKAGAGIDVQDGEGKTALMRAAEEGKDSVVKFLLEKGANPFCKNNNRRDAFLLAKKVSTARIIREHISLLSKKDRERMESEAKLSWGLLACNAEKAVEGISSLLESKN